MKLFVGLRITVLFFLFCIDVRVNATTSNLEKKDHQSALFAHVIQHPSHCLKQVTECAIKTKTKNFTFQGEGYELALGPQSTIIRHSSEELTLVQGSLWVRSHSKFKVKTEYGTVYSRSALNTFFLKDKTRLEVMPLDGSVMVERLGDDHDMFLPTGYRTFLSGVDNLGRSQYDIPTAANFKKIIEQWAPLFQGSPKELVQILTSYRSKWTSAVVQGAEIHQQLYERTVAEAKENRRRAEERKAAIRRENAKLRELFRRKNYLE